MPGPAVDLGGSSTMFTIREALPSELDVLNAIDDDATPQRVAMRRLL